MRGAFRTLAIVILMLQASLPFLQPVSSDITDWPALEVRGPIRIEGDAGFINVSNGVRSGSGTGPDPYIISDHSIEAPGVHGIEIVNTTKHFVIRNVHVGNGTGVAGIRLDNAGNGVVKDARLHSDSVGIWISDCDGVSIRNVRIDDGLVGLRLEDSSGVGIEDIVIEDISTNAIFGNVIDGISVTGAIIGNNEIGIGISQSNDVNITDTELTGSAQFGTIFEANDDTFIGNVTFSNNRIDVSIDQGNRFTNIIGCSFGVHGAGDADQTSLRVRETETVLLSGNVHASGRDLDVRVNSTKDVVIEDISISGGVDGMRLDGDEDVIVRNVTASGLSGTAVIIEASAGVDMMDIDISGSGTGITVKDGSATGALSGSVIDGNGKGLVIDGSRGWRVNDTWFVDNDLGISLTDGTGDLVYNNVFDNDVNSEMDASPGNMWWVSRRAGPNIVDGPEIGGNWWSDYTGIDSDGDWFGDTPYGGDGLPLIDRDTVAPWIEDITNGTPTTGDQFTFEANATDNERDPKVSLNYTVNGGSGSEAQMVKFQGVFSYILKVPADAETIGYRMIADDLNDNVVNTTPRTIEVMDDDDPVIELLTEPPVIGEGWYFVFNATDNRALFDIYVELWFDTDTGGKQRHDLLPTKRSYNISVSGWEDVHEVHYHVNCTDAAGNSVDTIGTFSVADTVPPVISDIAYGDPMTGQEWEITFKGWDNRNVSIVYMDLSYEDGVPMRRYLNESQGFFRERLDVRSVAGNLTFRIHMLDDSGNEATHEETLGILDGEGPDVTIWIPTHDAGNGTVAFNARVTDKMSGIASVRMTYTVDIESGARDMVALNGTVFRYIEKLALRKDTNITVKVVATDTAGNVFETSKRFEVDVPPPVKEPEREVPLLDNSNVPNFALLFMLIIGAAVAIAFSMTEGVFREPKVDEDAEWDGYVDRNDPDPPADEGLARSKR